MLRLVSDTRIVSVFVDWQVGELLANGAHQHGGGLLRTIAVPCCTLADMKDVVD
jgi:hypothetical protein